MENSLASLLEKLGALLNSLSDEQHQKLNSFMKSIEKTNPAEFDRIHKIIFMVKIFPEYSIFISEYELEMNKMCNFLTHFCKIIKMIIENSSIEGNEKEIVINNIKNVDEKEIGNFFYLLSSVYGKYIKGKSDHIDQSEKNIKEMYAHIKSVIGIAGLAIHFNDVKEEERKSSRNWLWISGILIVFIAIFAGQSLIKLFTDVNIQEFNNFQMRFFLTRLIYMFILAIIAIWTSRRYIDAKQRHVTYRHLSCVLGALESFKDSMKDKERDTLLLEAAQSVFPVPKFSNAKMSQNELSNVIDLIKIGLKEKNIMVSDNK